MITTARLLLTEVRQEDSSLLADFWRELPGNSAEDSQRTVRFMLDRQAAGQGRFWLLKQGGKSAANNLLGTCELNNIDRQTGSADIGCALLPAWRGRGLMREALSAVISYAFAEELLTELWADIAQDNQSSRNLFARASFIPAVRVLNPLVRNKAVVSMVLYKNNKYQVNTI